MEHRTCRVDAERRTRGQLGITPALALYITGNDHMVGENFAEAGVGDAFCPFGCSNGVGVRLGDYPSHVHAFAGIGSIYSVSQRCPALQALRWARTHAETMQMTGNSENGGRVDDGYGIARLNLAASPLFLRDAEVMRGLALLQMGAVHLAAQADGLLRDVGIGRAHARLLAHVVQWPGNAIADYVPITATSKQALGRVARDLERRNFIEIRPGQRDRRQRLLFASAAGEQLSAQINGTLSRALAEAYASAGQNAVSGFWRVLEGMVPVASHAAIAELARRRGAG